MPRTDAADFIAEYKLEVHLGQRYFRQQTEHFLRGETILESIGVYGSSVLVTGHLDQNTGTGTPGMSVE